jgi:hypothetical protein
MATGQLSLVEGNYVPDPGRDIAAVIDGFFAHIATTLRERALPIGTLWPPSAGGRRNWRAPAWT